MDKTFLFALSKNIQSLLRIYFPAGASLNIIIGGLVQDDASLQKMITFFCLYTAGTGKNSQTFCIAYYFFDAVEVHDFRLWFEPYVGRNNPGQGFLPLEYFIKLFGHLGEFRLYPFLPEIQKLFRCVFPLDACIMQLQDFPGHPVDRRRCFFRRKDNAFQIQFVESGLQHCRRLMKRICQSGHIGGKCKQNLCIGFIRQHLQQPGDNSGIGHV